MDLLTVQEAAAMLRVSQVTLRRYVASGKLPAVRVGRNVRIERSAAEGIAMPVPAVRPASDEPGGELPDNPKVFTLDAAFWSIVGMIDDDSPNDMASDKYKHFPRVYGDNDEG